jgi:hypothetical protein
VITAADAKTARGAGSLPTAGATKDTMWFRTVARLSIQAAEALDHAH